MDTGHEGEVLGESLPHRAYVPVVAPMWFRAEVQVTGQEDRHLCRRWQFPTVAQPRQLCGEDLAQEPPEAPVLGGGAGLEVAGHYEASEVPEPSCWPDVHIEDSPDGRAATRPAVR
jgi:hypothetical protein